MKKPTKKAPPKPEISNQVVINPDKNPPSNKDLPFMEQRIIEILADAIRVSSDINSPNVRGTAASSKKTT